jgi:hypothetical protein
MFVDTTAGDTLRKRNRATLQNKGDSQKNLQCGA